MDPSRVKVVDQFLKDNQVIPRSAWGAAVARLPDGPNSDDWDYNTVVIHHSGRWGETNPIAIQSLHMNDRGWSDVAYHFMVGPAGQIYEGRRLYFKGAHVDGANTGKVGILVMGNFEKEIFGLMGGTPSPQQITTTKLLVQRLKARFPTIRVLGGHKDYNPKKECPGNQLYPLLGDMRMVTGLSAPGK